MKILNERRNSSDKQVTFSDEVKDALACIYQNRRRIQLKLF